MVNYLSLDIQRRQSKSLLGRYVLVLNVLVTILRHIHPNCKHFPLNMQAFRSDVTAKPNPFKLLYAFEMHRHNWRRAASYIYLYSAQLRTESFLKDHQRRSLCLQERLNALSAAINALHLVHPAYAWVDPLLEERSLQKETYPSKRTRRAVEEQCKHSFYMYHYICHLSLLRLWYFLQIFLHFTSIVTFFFLSFMYLVLCSFSW